MTVGVVPPGCRLGQRGLLTALNAERKFPANATSTSARRKIYSKAVRTVPAAPMIIAPSTDGRIGIVRLPSKRCFASCPCP